jgi:enamine deaminase RidA (YjgF/YER057c/UK114 family)
MSGKHYGAKATVDSLRAGAPRSWQVRGLRTTTRAFKRDNVHFVTTVTKCTWPAVPAEGKMRISEDRKMAANYSNPPGVHSPLGLYSHTVVVPAGTELVFLSGQVGVRPDGSAPATISEQADQVFANIVTLLRAHGLDATSIVKLTTFMVAGHDGDAVRAARIRHLGSHRPASTAVFVAQLVDPAWLVEVDAVASRADGAGLNRRADVA